MDREPLEPKIVKKTVAHHVSTGEAQPMNQGFKGALIGILNEAGGGDAGRHHILEYLFGKKSSKQLTDAEWYALARWVDGHKDELTNKWVGSAAFYTEVKYILRKEDVPPKPERNEEELRHALGY